MWPTCTTTSSTTTTNNNNNTTSASLSTTPVSRHPRHQVVLEVVLEAAAAAWWCRSGRPTVRLCLRDASGLQGVEGAPGAQLQAQERVPSLRHPLRHGDAVPEGLQAVAHPEEGGPPVDTQAQPPTTHHHHDQNHHHHHLLLLPGGRRGKKELQAAAEADSGVEKSEIEEKVQEKVQEKEVKEPAGVVVKRENSGDRKTIEKNEEKPPSDPSSAERKGRAAADALNRQIKEVVSTGSSYR
ncbi:hypothetical protein CRUP_031693 [Coryphaenoides rupestris]|nr:hypothetical protein CRUP_031693 [Coryphaenoides rupestris]